MIFASEASSGGMGGMSMIILMVALIALMYFMMIRPQKKEQKRMQAMLSSLEIGDAVVTNSGFYGVIIDITEEDVIVEFGNNKNCRIPMRKRPLFRWRSRQMLLLRFRKKDTKTTDKKGEITGMKERTARREQKNRLAVLSSVRVFSKTAEKRCEK